MKMQPAVELSYLDEESQRDLVDIIDGTEEYVLKALSYYKKHLDRKAQKEIDKKQ